MHSRVSKEACAHAPNVQALERDPDWDIVSAHEGLFLLLLQLLLVLVILLLLFYSVLQLNGVRLEELLHARVKCACG